MELNFGDPTPVQEFVERRVVWVELAPERLSPTAPPWQRALGIRRLPEDQLPAGSKAIHAEATGTSLDAEIDDGITAIPGSRFSGRTVPEIGAMDGMPGADCSSHLPRPGLHPPMGPHGQRGSGQPTLLRSITAKAHASASGCYAEGFAHWQQGSSASRDLEFLRCRCASVCPQPISFWPLSLPIAQPQDQLSESAWAFGTLMDILSIIPSVDLLLAFGCLV